MYGVCTDVDASTSLNRAVDRSIESPAVSKTVTAVFRASVVAGDIYRLI